MRTARVTGATSGVGEVIGGREDGLQVLETEPIDRPQPRLCDAAAVPAPLNINRLEIMPTGQSFAGLQIARNS